MELKQNSIIKSQLQLQQTHIASNQKFEKIRNKNHDKL